MPQNNDFERRSIAGPIEMRAASDTVNVEGHAAVFNQEANIAGMFIETFAPGAFRAAIGRDDVIFLINHEGLPLAQDRREDATS